MEDYKEKLRLAKEALDSGSYDKETIEYIFPELKESKDERMRKECISIIDAWDKACCLQGDYCEVAPECIAWLEKQGEQKSKKVSLWKHWKDGIAGNGEDKLVYLIKNGDTYSLSSCLGYECDYIELSELNKLLLSEKQSEQKPTDKVEQEYVELTNFESALFSAFSDAWQEYLSGKEVNVAKWAREHSAELLEVVREQKPAWSEEDKDTYKRVYCLFENALDKWYECVFAGCYPKITKKKVLAMLKSLKERVQPQNTWKPSDEQMKLLREVQQALLGKDCHNRFVNFMYELKRLKEK